MKPIFSSELLNFCGIIRMYEHSTCEIALLSGQNSPVWWPTPPMPPLQTNLDDSSPQARSSSHPNAVPDLPANLSRKVYASAPVPPATSGSLAQLPLPVPSNAPALCGWSWSPETSPWFSDPLGRWSPFSFRQKAVGALPDGGEVLHGQYRRLFRSPCSCPAKRVLSAGSKCSRVFRGRSGFGLERLSSTT
jgi:hypothetical protein